MIDKWVKSYALEGRVHDLKRKHYVRFLSTVIPQKSFFHLIFFSHTLNVLIVFVCSLNDSLKAVCDRDHCYSKPRVTCLSS